MNLDHHHLGRTKKPEHRASNFTKIFNSYTIRPLLNQKNLTRKTLIGCIQVIEIIGGNEEILWEKTITISNGGILNLKNKRKNK